MNIGESSGKQKCPKCLRKKEEAICEQVQLKKVCSEATCPFRKEIQEAILAEEQTQKFVFGNILKQEIHFGEPLKPEINFGEPIKPSFTFDS